MFNLAETQPPPSQWVRCTFAAFVAMVIACGSSEFRTPVGNGHEICQIHGTGIFVTGGDDLLVPPRPTLPCPRTSSAPPSDRRGGPWYPASKTAGAAGKRTTFAGNSAASAGKRVTSAGNGATPAGNGAIPAGNGATFAGKTASFAGKTSVPDGKTPPRESPCSDSAAPGPLLSRPAAERAGPGRA